ncbi:class I fructose-bisphosphate aldolase [Parvularcula sp. LCG005]|uniref:class I fructose-bisphosphate aldolase n=1 Tax=Parvularcula sp. LCG005 TaxID=3078805 RepID=UPI0029430A5D|nr:class I fructose-bisphosphate aldolase [Parvularcula sp. LCG005]WOI54016.1 class I fructose-bisphosphate aldolase [Parvularcula sp. LCG005]
MSRHSLNSLADIAHKMVVDGRGILAADESLGTIKKRFDSIGIESTEEHRRAYRDMLFTAGEAVSKYISGVILFDETIHQSTENGTPFPEQLTRQDCLPGIKVDRGAKPLALATTETITEGLDGLRDRLNGYYDKGARFAKWRAVIHIGHDGRSSIPTHQALRANMHALGRYAALCQEAGIVPIVEPEVLMDGDHDMARCFGVTARVLDLLYRELFEQRVALEGTILKPNMIVAGKGASEQPSTEMIAEATVKCFRQTVPAAVPGIVFLSGGQSELEATRNLNTMNRMYAGEMPWKLSFSYGRALQASALAAWGGKPENVPAAQKAFTHRARMNYLAARGEWDEAQEG